MGEKQKQKLIKDSVHGYIAVGEKFVKVINTALFQRLKRLQQTSYRVLYPSASHDRFIHSIGVFYLGSLAFNSIKENTSEKIIDNFSEEIAKWEKPFLTACLLHDIGHAPFSHTCEEFFDDKLLDDFLEALKIKTTQEIFNTFKTDYNKDPRAKPHEVMSALLVLKNQDLYISELLKEPEDFDFVTRAIMGNVYRSIVSEGKGEREIKNALIKLRNPRPLAVVMS